MAQYEQRWPAGWEYRIDCGETIQRGRAADKQDAADKATAAWPGAVARERVRIGKIDAKRRLEEQMTAAWRSGAVDVMAFGIAGSEYQRLVDMLGFMRQKNWLRSPLKPLAEAVSAELYRRRTGGG